MTGQQVESVVKPDVGTPNAGLVWPTRASAGTATYAPCWCIERTGGCTRSRNARTAWEPSRDACSPEPVAQLRRRGARCPAGSHCLASAFWGEAPPTGASPGPEPQPARSRPERRTAQGAQAHVSSASPNRWNYGRTGVPQSCPREWCPEVVQVMRSETRGAHRSPQPSGSKRRSDVWVRTDLPCQDRPKLAGTGESHILPPSTLIPTWPACATATGGFFSKKAGSKRREKPLRKPSNWPRGSRILRVGMTLGQSGFDPADLS